jgi:hypothetical protein
MAVSANLRKLIAAVAPLWAGESEVVRSYWDSTVRSHESDLLWMRRQCSKEFNGKGIGEYRDLGVFMGPVTELEQVFPRIDAGVDRHYALDLIEMLHDEFEHYVLIADIYDVIRGPGEPPINAQTLETWDEDVALTELRFKHMRDHGEIGKRASRFTEGGYCALFREGMALKGRGGADDMIADAFARIFEDEFGHMLSGIIGLDAAGLDDASWTLLGDLAVAQMQHRIHMRNAQFGFPVSAERIKAIFAGDITPMEFDYEKAGERVAA